MFSVVAVDSLFAHKLGTISAEMEGNSYRMMLACTSSGVAGALVGISIILALEITVLSLNQRFNPWLPMGNIDTDKGSG